MGMSSARCLRLLDLESARTAFRQLSTLDIVSTGFIPILRRMNLRSMVSVILIIGVHFRIIPTRTLGGINDRNALLVDRQRLHVEQRPKSVELFIAPPPPNELAPRFVFALP